MRSSVTGVLLTLLLTIGLGALITSAVRSHWSQSSALRRATFDPVSTSLSGTLFAQFAVGVIGVLFITAEYSSGSIRTSLAAVPKRLHLVVAKAFIVALVVIVVAEVACFVTFVVGQTIFSGVVPTASLANGAVLRSVILAGVYLTLLSLVGMGLGLILRQSAASISVFTSLLLILPILTLLLPQSWQNALNRFEPSQLGQSMMSPTVTANTLSAWSALLILVLYTVVVVGVGAGMLERRDH
ncbi:MAG: ABC transporter permease subunit [Acidobacteriota bacterium]|nr:ABC transporter permease subunit [Acidobacteriota bacterium]MDE3043697.1 ABC transporter permease subunit [Acidobacteriota bacterium]MDE3107051.1 ABC transporter permease subunit [Acidobacteriota bacterium]MDE3223137.1 ABC transporter permease subunit [Acidobacteriota bacterium]